MSVTLAVLVGLATGIVFGFALEKSRVFEPGIIIGQMQLKNFIMLKVFLAAVVTGLVVLAALNGLFGVKLNLKPLLWKADIIGGLILGMGIVIAGACPGTSLAQLGAGYRDALFVVAGGIVGAVFYGYNDAAITAFFAEKGDKIGFDQLLGLPFWVSALGLAALLTTALIALERFVPSRAELGVNVDGLTTREAGGAGRISTGGLSEAGR